MEIILKQLKKLKVKVSFKELQKQKINFPRISKQPKKMVNG